MTNKIMSVGNLEDIVARLHGCYALLLTIHQAIPDHAIYTDALYEAADHLEVICRDFQADIDAAEEMTT